MTYVVQTIFDAMSLGSLYALVALGIGLIFGVMRLVNFAHGDLITIGGYALIVPSASASATLLVGAWPWPLMVFAVVTIVMLAALLVERVAFRPLRTSDATTMLIASFAVSFFVQNAILFEYGSRPKGLSIGTTLSQTLMVGGVRILLLDLLIVAVTAGLLVAMASFLRWSKYGIWIRAASENFNMTRLLGVRANTVIGIAFAASGVLAAAVSFFVVIKGGLLTYRMGVPLVLMGFVATVIGGMGSLLGAVVGGYLVGAVSVVMQAALPESLRGARDAFVFLVVILILLLRPGGLLQAPALRERV
ncbi:MAG: branched-chain amino acid ABC transporter permease [Rhizobiaceae bacterium]